MIEDKLERLAEMVSKILKVKGRETLSSRIDNSLLRRDKISKKGPVLILGNYRGWKSDHITVYELNKNFLVSLFGLGKRRVFSFSTADLTQPWFEQLTYKVSFYSGGKWEEKIQSVYSQLVM